MGFLLEAVIIAGVLLGTGLIRDVPYSGDRSVDVVGSILSVLGMSLLVLGVLPWQEGGESVAMLLLAGTLFSFALVRWLIRRHRDGKPTLVRSHTVLRAALQVRNPAERLPAGRTGRTLDRPAHVPPDRSRLQRAASRPVAGAAVADHVRH